MGGQSVTHLIYDGVIAPDVCEHVCVQLYVNAMLYCIFAVLLVVTV